MIDNVPPCYDWAQGPTGATSLTAAEAQLPARRKETQGIEESDDEGDTVQLPLQEAQGVGKGQDKHPPSVQPRSNLMRPSPSSTPTCTGAAARLGLFSCWLLVNVIVVTMLPLFPGVVAGKALRVAPTKGRNYQKEEEANVVVFASKQTTKSTGPDTCVAGSVGISSDEDSTITNGSTVHVDCGGPEAQPDNRPKQKQAINTLKEKYIDERLQNFDKYLMGPGASSSQRFARQTPFDNQSLSRGEEANLKTSRSHELPALFAACILPQLYLYQ